MFITQGWRSKRLPKSDIEDEESVSTEVAPLGSATITGLAWHPDEDALYWIIDEGAGPLLVKSNNFGDQDSLVPAVALDLDELTLGETALVGDMTWNLETATFWAVDLANDIIFEFGTDGVATGESFPNPALIEIGDETAGGAYGTH